MPQLTSKGPRELKRSLLVPLGVKMNDPGASSKLAFQNLGRQLENLQSAENLLK